MGRSEVRGLLTPINGRIVGCHGKPCDYMSNLFLGIAKVLQKSVKKLLTIVIWFGIISELDVRTAGTHEL